MRELDLEVEVDGDLIVVSELATRFIAIYARPTAMPQLILRKRAESDDYELFASMAGGQRQGARVGVDCVAPYRRFPANPKLLSPPAQWRL